MKKIAIDFIKSVAANLKTIFFALLLSVITWFAVSFQLFPMISQRVDVTVVATPTAYMLDDHLELASGGYTDTVNVEIEGKRYDIGGLDGDDFDAYLDLSDVKKPGEYYAKVIVQPRNGVKCRVLDENIPARKIKVIQTSELMLAIIPKAEVSASEGMHIDYDNLEVTPKTVTVSGEKSLIDSIEKAVVTAVSAEELSATANLSGSVAFYGKNGSVIDVSDINVEDRAFAVTVPVFKQKSLPLEISFINVPHNFNLNSLTERMRITPGELTVSTPDSSIDNYDRINIGTVSLNELTLKNLQEGFSKTIELPDGYSNITGNKAATLTFDDVDKYGFVAFELSGGNFVTANVPAGYEVKPLTKHLTVKVVGPSSFIKSMTSEDISVTVSLAGITDITEGVRTVGVKFVIAGANVEAWVIDEYKISIEIVKTD